MKSRKPRKHHRRSNREQVAHVHTPFRDRAACPNPTKEAFATRHHAKKTLKRGRAMFARTAKEHAADPEHRGVALGMPRVYRCPCGRWHIGHLPKSVRSGPGHRYDVYGDERAA